jgi:hypothetical protein
VPGEDLVAAGYADALAGKEGMTMNDEGDSPA